MTNFSETKRLSKNQRKQKFGFTLVELLIVIAIIGLLASIVLVYMNNARKLARDAQRKANLRQIQTALELYYTEYLSYPSTGGNWHAEGGTWGSYPLYSSDAYIPNISPRFTSSLPHDPNTGMVNSLVAGMTGASGGPTCTPQVAYYAYKSDGKDYKFMTSCLNESVLPSTDYFYDPSRPGWSFQVSTSGGRNW